MTVALVDARVDRETAAKRMRADVSQALPAAAATATAGVKAPRARRTRETSPHHSEVRPSGRARLGPDGAHKGGKPGALDHHDGQGGQRSAA